MGVSGELTFVESGLVGTPDGLRAMGHQVFETRIDKRSD